MRALIFGFALMMLGIIFIPLMLMVLTFLFILKPYQMHPEEDWDKVLADE